ncbi:MAG: GNAT family N-acetyltransferase [Frankia sp.]
MTDPDHAGLGPLELRRGSPADLPSLEPLWVSVHHRHAETMPELAPYVDDARTWTVRSALYIMGVNDLVLGALPGNAAAIRLYERLGFRPTWTYLSRFAGR